MQKPRQTVLLHAHLRALPPLHLYRCHVKDILRRRCSMLGGLLRPRHRRRRNRTLRGRLWWGCRRTSIWLGRALILVARGCTLLVLLGSSSGACEVVRSGGGLRLFGHERRQEEGTRGRKFLPPAICQLTCAFWSAGRNFYRTHSFSLLLFYCSLYFVCLVALSFSSSFLSFLILSHDSISCTLGYALKLRKNKQLQYMYSSLFFPFLISPGFSSKHCSLRIDHRSLYPCYPSPFFSLIFFFPLFLLVSV